MIFSYYSYNIHNDIFLLVSHYPDFLITSYIHTFENYVQFKALEKPEYWHTPFSIPVVCKQGAINTI